MGTAAPKEETPAGVIQRAGHTANVITEATSEAAYGRTRGALYPLVLVIVAVAAILLGYALAALIPLTLLAVWLGGHR